MRSAPTVPAGRSRNLLVVYLLLFSLYERHLVIYGAPVAGCTLSTAASGSSGSESPNQRPKKNGVCSTTGVPHRNSWAAKPVMASMASRPLKSSLALNSLRR